MSCYDEDSSKRQTSTLLACPSIKYKCIVILAVLTRFRRGKIVGLHWADTDFKNDKISF